MSKWNKSSKTSKFRYVKTLFKTQISANLRNWLLEFSEANKLTYSKEVSEINVILRKRGERRINFTSINVSGSTGSIETFYFKSI